MGLKEAPVTAIGALVMAIGALVIAIAGRIRGIPAELVQFAEKTAFK